MLAAGHPTPEIASPPAHLDPDRPQPHPEHPRQARSPLQGRGRRLRLPEAAALEVRKPRRPLPGRPPSAGACSPERIGASAGSRPAAPRRRHLPYVTKGETSMSRTICGALCGAPVCRWSRVFLPGRRRRPRRGPGVLAQVPDLLPDLPRDLPEAEPVRRGVPPERLPHAARRPRSRSSRSRSRSAPTPTSRCGRRWSTRATCPATSRSP